MMGKIVGRLLKGRDISVLAAWPGSHSFSLSEFSSGEIETFHLGETGAIKREIAVECPLNVDWIEIQGIPVEPAGRDISERLLWVENFIHREIRLKIILPLESVQLKLIFFFT